MTLSSRTSTLLHQFDPIPARIIILRLGRFSILWWQRCPPRRPGSLGLNSGIASMPLAPLYSVTPRRLLATAALFASLLPASSTEVGRNFESLNNESKVVRPVGLGCEGKLPSPPGPPYSPVPWPCDSRLLPGSHFLALRRAAISANELSTPAILCSW